MYYLVSNSKFSFLDAVRKRKLIQVRSRYPANSLESRLKVNEIII